MDAFWVNFNLAVLSSEFLRTMAEIIVWLSIANTIIVTRFELITEVDELTAVLSTITISAILTLIVI